MKVGWSAVDLIRRKRDGLALSREELGFLVGGYARGEIPDYQMSALLMAAYLRGLDEGEMTDLTLAMVDSGARVDLGDDPRIVDKHSTGGVGDKVSLVVVPLVASAGGVVAKMSGRGLGHSGGTLDKLESIPGFRVALSAEMFRRQIAEVGAVIAGQSADLVPADRMIYALRDVTATVESTGLIAASIMSKKIAGGARRLVLDVKTGNGAFMRDRAGASELARAMVSIGRLAGMRVKAVVSDMNQPLGHAAGNALEVAEAIGCLRGEGPSDLEEICLEIAGRMVVLAGLAADIGSARRALERLLHSGEAVERFRRLIVHQGGDGRVVDRPWDVLPRAPARSEARAGESGCVAHIDTLSVGRLVMRLGAGRVKKDDPIDPSVGAVLAAKLGDRVSAGDVLGVVHGRDPEAARAGARELSALITIAASPPSAERELILETLE